MIWSLRLVWIGLALVILGIGLIPTVDDIFDYVLYTNLPLTPYSKMFEPWRQPPVSVMMTMYFFNCTNSHEMKDRHFKPNFEEIGPYVFKEIQEKVNITWNANHTITYRHVRRWYFDPEKSNGTLKDKIITVNPSALGASYVTRHWSRMASYPLSLALRMFENTIWLSTTVQEYMFDGVNDPLLTIAHTVPALASVKPPYDKVAIFYNRNDSSLIEGVFNMDTGTQDITKLGELQRWNYNNQTDFFKDQCSEVRGSPSGLFSPGQARDKPVEMFLTDMCRSLKLEYSEDTEVNGIPGYKYTVGKGIIDNGTTDLDTVCNCGGECLPQGVLNTSLCRFGAPAFVSFPHFLDADPYYISRVNGLVPDPKRHRFHLILEPKTGAPLELTLRLQMNLLLQPNSKLSLFEDVPTVMFPVVWMEGYVKIPPEFVTPLKMILMLPSLGLYFSLTFLLLGIFLITFSILRFQNKRKRVPCKKYIRPVSITQEIEVKIPEEMVLLNREESNININIIK